MATTPSSILLASTCLFLAVLPVPMVVLAEEPIDIGSHKQPFIAPFDAQGRDAYLTALSEKSAEGRCSGAAFCEGRFLQKCDFNDVLFFSEVL